MLSRIKVALRMYCWCIFLVLISAGVPGTMAAERPSVSDLLDKYAETQNKIQHSFNIKSESSGKFSYKHKSSKRSGEAHSFSEIRFDGDRTSLRTLRWGDLTSKIWDLPRSEALYRSYLWDGEQYISYLRESFGGKYPNTAIINKDYGNENMALRGGLHGQFRGDYERVDSILRQARNISMRHDLDEIKGNACYVIDAITEQGKYTLWIDPNHGYNIAKAIVRKKEHQLFPKRPPSKNYVSLEVIENVRFEQIDGVWVPMEADLKYDGNYAHGYFSKSETHIKRTEVILNPDHDALGSFVPDDIENGSKVRVVQVPGVTYTWQDGELIPNINKAERENQKGQKPNKKR